MEARSPSSTSLHSFAPGPHRRSHPNLQHLSLAPLQPKYPITPSDYEPYVDPQTSNLHTSASLSRLSSPTTPPIHSSLSHSRSTNPSSTRLNGLQRRTKKDQHLPQPLTTSTTANTSKSITPATITTSPAPLTSATSTSTPWFIQTGLSLTSSTAESKGQAWLSKRESSTALTSPGMTPPFRTPTDEPREYGFPGSASVGHRTAPASRPHTPNTRSRRASRSRVSRRDLAMTPAAAAEKLINDSLRKSRSSGSSVVFTDGKVGRATKGLGEVPGGMKPDWVDEQTRKEADREERERERELMGMTATSVVDWQGVGEEDEEGDGGVFEYTVAAEGGLGEEGEDGFGLGKGDEQELRQQVRTSAFGVGKWIDGWVDALLKVGEDDDDYDYDKENEVNSGSPVHKKDLAESPNRRRDGEKEKVELSRDGADAGDGGEYENEDEGRRHRPGDRDRDSDSPRETAPPNPANVWEDVRWLGKLVWDTAIS